MAVAQGILTARAAPPATPPSSPARSASRASPAARSWWSTTRARSAHRQRHHAFSEGDWISLDGTTGEVLRRRAADRVAARFEDQPELQQILGWADEHPPHAGLDQRRQAGRGRPGPGLRRAGHRPVPDRAHVPRGRAAGDRARRHPRRQRRHPGQGRQAAGETLDADGPAAVVARFDAAMAKLEVLQQGDFEGIFEAMDGLPVVIRLIDPPLHEFLPNLEELIEAVVNVARAVTPPRRGPRPDPAGRRSSRCTSRTRCWACAAVGWA